MHTRQYHCTSRLTLDSISLYTKFNWHKPTEPSRNKYTEICVINSSHYITRNHTQKVKERNNSYKTQKHPTPNFQLISYHNNHLRISSKVTNEKKSTTIHKAPIIPSTFFEHPRLINFDSADIQVFINHYEHYECEVYAKTHFISTDNTPRDSIRPVNLNFSSTLSYLSLLSHLSTYRSPQPTWNVISGTTWIFGQRIRGGANHCNYQLALSNHRSGDPYQNDDTISNISCAFHIHGLHYTSTSPCNANGPQLNPENFSLTHPSSYTTPSIQNATRIRPRATVPTFQKNLSHFWNAILNSHVSWREFKRSPVHKIKIEPTTKSAPVHLLPTSGK